MGVAATIVGTLFSSWMQGRAQQAQAEAAARQSEQNAQIAQMNADKAQETAERQDENNKINAEMSDAGHSFGWGSSVRQSVRAVSRHPEVLRRLLQIRAMQSMSRQA